VPRIEGLIFHVQRFSLQDGPGLRSTVFLKGCPLACTWCHNPESQNPEPELFTVESRCFHCGACKGVCSNPECRSCGLCVEACPSGARQMAGRRVRSGQLLEELLRDRLFFDQSGGGVSFSGGEPLMQADFVCELASALKGQGVHTALDTCGFARREDLLRVAACVDLVLYDLKLIDEARHQEATGESSALILANLEALSQVHSAIRIRVPIIPGLNDDEGNLEATARIAARTRGLRRVDLLPYHANGAAKFGRLGKSYSLDAVRAPSAERMEEIAGRFRARGIEVCIGGRA